jgi:hypothetical protein
MYTKSISSTQKFYLLLSLYISIINLANGKCMFYQPTLTTKPEKATTVEQQTPKMYDDPGVEFLRVCPDFIGKEVCCDDVGRQLMLQNFMKLALIVECQNCKNNIYRMM